MTVSDGIVRIYGTADAMQGEMIELPENTYALALNHRARLGPCGRGGAG